jgi:hypothetical protein
MAVLMLLLGRGLDGDAVRPHGTQPPTTTKQSEAKYAER